MTYQPIFFQPIHRAADAGDVDALRRKELVRIVVEYAFHVGDC